MKALKYSLGFLAFLALLFLLIGFIIPTFSYETSVEVASSREHAFTVFIDETRTADWLTGLRSIELISGSPREIGSKYRLVIVDRGEEMVMTEELTAFDENEFYAFKLDNDVMLADAEIRFAGDEAGTRIVSKTAVEGKGIFWRSLLPLFKSMMVKRSQEDYNKLKRVIETTPDVTDSQSSDSMHQP